MAESSLSHYKRMPDRGVGSVDGYERSVVTRHPDLPGYPGPADIELYKSMKQGMSWERASRYRMEIVIHYYAKVVLCM
jgi:hypothetical protein